MAEETNKFASLANLLAEETEEKIVNSNDENDSFKPEVTSGEFGKETASASEGGDKVKVTAADALGADIASELLVDGSEEALSLIFTGLYVSRERKKFTDKMEIIDVIEEKDPKELTPEEAELLARWNTSMARLRKRREALGFDADDKAKLKKYAGMMASKRGMTVSPELAFFVTFARLAGNHFVDYALDR